jgi:hypothetical protein
MIYALDCRRVGSACSLVALISPTPPKPGCLYVADRLWSPHRIEGESSRCKEELKRNRGVEELMVIAVASRKGRCCLPATSPRLPEIFGQVASVTAPDWLLLR